MPGELQELLVDLLEEDFAEFSQRAFEANASAEDLLDSPAHLAFLVMPPRPDV